MADELIRLDTTIIGIDSLINKALTAEEAKVLFTVKDVIYSQQRYFTDVQPVNQWISVENKLPEVGKVVIVCDKQGGVGAMELLSTGQWYHRGMAWSAEWILYWQPLPEPPKQ